MNILEKVQIGLDLATAISIVGATVTFAYRYSKENKKQRKQRVAEFGSKVIIDDLHSLTDLYRELNEGYRAIPFSDFSKTISSETTEQFYKRINDNFSDVELLSNLVSKLDRTFEAFCKILANQANTITCKMYSCSPILVTISRFENIEENSLTIYLVEKIRTYHEQYSRLIQFKYLWKELLVLYTKKEEFKRISLKVIYEERNSNVSYANFYNLIKSIALDDNYNEFVDSSILAKDEVLNASDLSHLTESQRDNYYKLYKVEPLHTMLYSNEMTSLFHNIVAHADNLAMECISETKEVLCTLSAIYSYILNDDVSLDDEVQKYKKLLELDKYIY